MISITPFCYYQFFCECNQFLLHTDHEIRIFQVSYGGENRGRWSDGVEAVCQRCGVRIEVSIVGSAWRTLFDVGWLQ